MSQLHKLYFLYMATGDSHEDRKVACLSVKTDGTKITGSKVIVENFAAKEKLTNKWAWVKTAPNHIFVGHSKVPDFLIPLVKVLHEALDPEAHKEDISEPSAFANQPPHVQELADMIEIITNYYTTYKDPSSVTEFPAFTRFTEKHGLGGDYMVEDLLIDIESIFEQRAQENRS